MPKMYNTDYPELVEDRDGDKMPFNPEAVGDMSLPSMDVADAGNWKHNWCRCGHLTVDHHCDEHFSSKHPFMPCWAVGCECKLDLGPL